MDNIREVKLFRDLGLNVIPCDPITKIPFAKKEKWKQWYDEKYTKPIPADSGIAAVCGKTSGNLVVIDIDSPEIVDNIFDDWDKVMTKRLVCRTGGGGYHMFVRVKELPDIMRLSSHTDSTSWDGKEKKQHIDIQSQGTIVVLPPSEHKSGKKYEIISPSHNISDFDIFGFIKSLERFGFKSSSKKRVKDIIKNGATEGERNDSAFRLCIYIHHLYPNITIQEMQSVLWFWNKKNRSQLSDDELESIATSALSYEVDLESSEAIKYGSDEFFDMLMKKARNLGKRQSEIRMHCCKCNVKFLGSDPDHEDHLVKF